MLTVKILCLSRYLLGVFHLPRFSKSGTVLDFILILHHPLVDFLNSLLNFCLGFVIQDSSGFINRGSSAGYFVPVSASDEFCSCRVFGDLIYGIGNINYLGLCL